jgi:hypothetical protein
MSASPGVFVSKFTNLVPYNRAINIEYKIRSLVHYPAQGLSRQFDGTKGEKLNRRQGPHRWLRPGFAIVARAHDRDHTHRLMDLGITEIARETYFSGLRLSELALDRLGIGAATERQTVTVFAPTTKSCWRKPMLMPVLNGA